LQKIDNQNSAKPQKTWLIWLRDIFIFLIIVLGITYWQTRNMLSTDGSVVVKQHVLPTLSNDTQTLLVSDKPNLVYFFAPWCQICALSIGNLSYLDTNKVNIKVVALDYSSKQDIIDFVEQNNVTLPVLIGNDSMQKSFAVQGYPTYYLINEDFVITSRSYGYSSAVGLKLREAFGG